MSNTGKILYIPKDILDEIKRIQAVKKIRSPSLALRELLKGGKQELKCPKMKFKI